MTAQKTETIKLLSAIVTALGTLVIVPMMGWLLITTVAQGERIISLETWRGEGRRYTDEDAKRDFGVIIERIEINEQGVIENKLAIRELERIVR